MSAVHEPQPAAPRADQIAQRLMREILRGDHRPGDPVREQAVADRMSVSRGTVREALQILEQDGLIETLPWRGARVVILTLADVEDLFTVSASLMSLAARFAAQRASDAELEQFAALVQAGAPQVSQPVARQLSAAFGYGAFLLRIARSPQVAGLEQRIMRKLYWQHRVLNIASPAWRRKAQDTWRVLAEALMTRDARKVARASAAIGRHARNEVFRIHRALGPEVYSLFDAAPASAERRTPRTRRPSPGSRPNPKASSARTG